jgi:hypothetical protein
MASLGDAARRRLGVDGPTVGEARRDLWTQPRLAIEPRRGDARLDILGRRAHEGAVVVAATAPRCGALAVRRRVAERIERGLERIVRVASTVAACVHGGAGIARSVDLHPRVHARVEHTVPCVAIGGRTAVAGDEHECRQSGNIRSAHEHLLGVHVRCTSRGVRLTRRAPRAAVALTVEPRSAWTVSPRRRDGRLGEELGGEVLARSSIRDALGLREEGSIPLVPLAISARPSSGRALAHLRPRTAAVRGPDGSCRRWTGASRARRFHRSRSRLLRFYVAGRDVLQGRTRAPDDSSVSCQSARTSSSKRMEKERV